MRDDASGSVMEDVEVGKDAVVVFGEKGCGDGREG